MQKSGYPVAFSNDRGDDTMATQEIPQYAKDVQDKPFGCYNINRGYLDYLRLFDTKIPHSDYTDYGQKEKFYIGPFVINDISYFVPVSHQPYDETALTHYIHKGFTYSKIQYGVPLRDANKSIVGSLDFRHMVPVVDKAFLKAHKFDRGYNGQIIKQAYAYRQVSGITSKNKTKLTSVAENVYSEITSKITDDDFIKDTSINMPKAYEHGIDYYNKATMINYVVNKPDKTVEQKTNVIIHKLEKNQTEDERQTLTTPIHETAYNNRNVIASAINDKRKTSVITEIATSYNSAEILRKRFDLTLYGSDAPPDDDDNSITKDYP